MFYTLTLENETGQQIDLSKTANRFMFSKIEGLNPPAGTVSTSSYAGMDGSYLNNAFIEKRNVVIPFEMLTKGQISILCPDIYWYSTETQIAEYSKIRGAFHFIFPDNDEPFPIGQYSTQNIMTIVNDGDEVGFTLEISGGPAKNPTIYNALTDEYMQILGDIKDGDIITITTKTGNKTVTLEREGVTTNIINRLVSGSTWLTLKQGENKFYVRASEGLSSLKVRLIHRNAYLGV